MKHNKCRWCKFTGKNMNSVACHERAAHKKEYYGRQTEMHNAVHAATACPIPDGFRDLMNRVDAQLKLNRDIDRVAAIHAPPNITTSYRITIQKVTTTMTPSEEFRQDSPGVPIKRLIVNKPVEEAHDVYHQEVGVIDLGGIIDVINRNQSGSRSQ